jgi:Mg2+ and Co2+ transporter CorA
MNFESLPLIHTETGFWVAMALMLAVGFGLIGFFWRQRYINHR